MLRRFPRLALFGPAFVAAIAYVDPGNVAANLSAGAEYGYLLVWVLVAASLMAMLIQYQSAKLGIVSGESLPELIGQRLRPVYRRAFWAQAEVMSVATDVAEVIGGALALKILFGVPLVAGGVIVGAASMGILLVQNRFGQNRFEIVVGALLAVTTVGFLCGLLFKPPSLPDTLHGLLPRFSDAGSVVLAASMLGATVMPHAIYLHSSLSRDRHRPVGQPAPSQARIALLVKSTKWDVAVALTVAGAVNVGMLLLAASTLYGVSGTETLEGSHTALSAALGPAIATFFAVALLASGLASTSVGSYAGASLMSGLLRVQVPLIIRRAVSLVPALALLWIGVDPTQALVLSQVVLSLSIPFALIPLIHVMSSSSVVGQFRNSTLTTITLIACVTVVILLNVTLVVLTLTGH